MRKIVFTLMASLLSWSAAQAFWPEATDSSLEIGVGYRKDSLKWRTASRFDDSYGSSYGYSSSSLGEVPLRVRSDLEWKNLQIWQIELNGKYVTCDNIYLKAAGDYGWITDGRNHDTDYLVFNGGSSSYGSGSYGDEIARSTSKVKGHVYDAKLAIGYQFKMCDDSFSISPLLGYSWHGQHFKDRHLKQNFYFGGEDITVYDDYYTGGTYSPDYTDYYYSDYYYFDSYSYYSGYSYGGNHSTYHTRWNGPFIGFDFDYRFWCDWTLFGGYEFHWAEFHARAHWDLRTDLLDGFKQRAKNAYGHVFDIGLKWDLCECWTVALKGQFQWWWADHGRDRSLTNESSFGDVRTNCYLSIPVKDIKWHSGSVSIDLGMVF